MKPRESRLRNSRLLDLRMRQAAQENAPVDEFERMRLAAIEVIRPAVEGMEAQRKSAAGVTN